MGFLDSLRKMLGGGSRQGRSSGGGSSRFGGDDAGTYWIYARCNRCGELLCARVNLYNDPSLADDGETWMVRKGLSGSGKNYCFQMVEVTLRFDSQKKKVLGAEATGGRLLTEEEYQTLKRGT